MKILHTSDLHIGKKLMGFSLLEDQKHMLDSIVGILKRENPDVLIVAGDIFDRSVPPEEGVLLFSSFVEESRKVVKNILIIPGNHDSAERLSFLSGILHGSGVYIAKTFSGTAMKVEIPDEMGKVNFFLLPHVREADARRFFSDENFDSKHSAIEYIVRSIAPDEKERNVLILHQFVLGSIQAESEDVVVGGLDGIDQSVLSSFDYVALGHLHSPQNIGTSGRIRYSGSPIPYSFSERSEEKGVSLIELGSKGELVIRNMAICPKRRMYVLSGFYDDLMARSFYEEKGYDKGFVEIELLDEYEKSNVLGKLRSVYPYIAKLTYRKNEKEASDVSISAEEKSPEELFSLFFESVNERKMTKEEETIVKRIMKMAWEGDDET